MEAEYIACYYLVQDIVWLRDVLQELGLLDPSSTTVYIDNTTARTLALNPVVHARSKLIDVKFHWLRHKVADGTITLEYVKSEDQTADILTKPLTGEAFYRQDQTTRLSSSLRLLAASLPPTLWGCTWSPTLGGSWSYAEVYWCRQRVAALSICIQSCVA